MPGLDTTISSRQKRIEGSHIYKPANNFKRFYKRSTLGSKSFVMTVTKLVLTTTKIR